MTSLSAFLYLVTLAGIAGIGVYSAAVRAYQRDAFRQQAFKMRDRLFDYAADGHVAFNDPAYYQLRLNMNRMIQFSHRLNFGEALLPMIILRGQQARPSASFLAWQQAVAEKPAEVREELKNIHHDFQELVIVHLIVTTPFVWLCIAPFALMHGLHQAIGRFVAKAWVIEEEASREFEGRHAQAA